MAGRWRIVEFQVRGCGVFPFDMLRYDCCFPVHETESPFLAADSGPARTVTLRTVTQRALEYVPSEGRWASFGWPVVDDSTRVWKG